MIQERAWIMDKTYVPFITICPKCGFLTDVDGAFMWNFCPDCGKDMRIPGPFYVPPKEDWIRQFGTNKQIAGYEKRNKNDDSRASERQGAKEVDSVSCRQ